MKERNWIIEETKAADFGDKRLNKRYESLIRWNAVISDGEYSDDIS